MTWLLIVITASNGLTIGVHVFERFKTEKSCLAHARAYKAAGPSLPMSIVCEKEIE